jgi:hypothetical protein
MWQPNEIADAKRMKAEGKSETFIARTLNRSLGSVSTFFYRVAAGEVIGRGATTQYKHANGLVGAYSLVKSTGVERSFGSITEMNKYIGENPRCLESARPMKELKITQLVEVSE